MYYDHVLGMLSDDRYQNMIADFEEQQERLMTEITVMEELIDWQREDSDNYDRFAALVEKYVDIPELITAIVNEFLFISFIFFPYFEHIPGLHPAAAHSRSSEILPLPRPIG